MSDRKFKLLVFVPLSLVVILFSIPFVVRRFYEACYNPSVCGNLTISHPFRLKGQTKSCNAIDFWIELVCDNNNHTIWVMNEGNFHVLKIFYSNSTIRLIDASLDGDNCSLPRSSFSVNDDFCTKTPTARHTHTHDVETSSDYTDYKFDSHSSYMYLENCTRPVKSSLYVDASRCSTNGSFCLASYFYFLDRKTAPRDFSRACTTIAKIPVMMKHIKGMPTLDIYQNLLLGFDVSWKQGFFHCEYYSPSTATDLSSKFKWLWHALRNVDNFKTKETYYHFIGITGQVIILRTLLGILCLLALVTHNCRRRHFSIDDTIEEFLQSQNNLAPIRYSFREIKKMTKDFKDKLGEGGYGLVFKGKLRSGHHVAIKLLGESKANGQDFINEVATIGRIHHVNVAKLVGFCVEGSKQALIYDFMVNGSLDKIIFSEENKNNLGWKKMFDIVLGVARGIDYLHQGCDMQILHFDIKPHNILLDEDFNPKVSDFGLAKLYSVDDSIVSLTTARGTIGYIAPELVYKNIGGVSYKADVYSFGMLVMEMIGKRKNLNAFAEHTSQIYFPSWIYGRLDQGEDIELGDVIDAEKELVRKMVIVAFWCIQMMPADRPSMSKVLKMLENDDEPLEMPPKPFYKLPLQASSEDHVCEVIIEAK